MWITIFFLWMTAAVSLGEDDACEETFYTACKFTDDLISEFPGSEDAFDSACSAFLPVVECMKDYVPNCQGSTEFLDRVQNLYNTSLEVCQKATLLHAAIAENIECMKQVKEDHSEVCDKQRQTILIQYKRHLLALYYNSTEEEDMDHEHWAMYSCLNTVYDISCFITNILESCGSTAKDAVVYLIRRGVFFQDSCTKESNKEVSAFLETLNFRTNEYMVLKEVLEEI